MRHSSGQAWEHGLGLPADQVGESRRNAAVRNVHHEGVDLLLEQFHGQVRQRAGAGRAVTELARVLLDVVNELLDVFDGQCGVDHQHIGRAANHADGREVFDGVIRHLAGGGAGAMGGHIALQQGVAVRRGAGRGLAGDHAAAAGLVVHQKTLLEQGAPALGHGAPDHVAAAAG